MTIVRKHAWFFVIIILAVMCTAIDYQLKNRVILSSFMNLELDEAQKNMARSMDVVKREIHYLNKLASDWSVWDDTYQFAKDANQAYIDSNLQMETLGENGEINLIYILTPEGKVVWGKVYDSEQGGDITVEEVSGRQIEEIGFLHDFGQSKKEVTGILITDHGPMLVASRPIFDSMGNGPSSGDLIMGRFLTKAILDSLVEQTKVNFDLKNILTNHLSSQEKNIINDLIGISCVVIPEDEDLLSVYGLLDDIYGRPALLVHASLPRFIMEKGRTAARYVSLSLMFTFVFGAVCLFFISKVYILDERQRTARVEALVERRTFELKQANEETELARIQAVEASKAKSEFLANMSHEIRTPLNGVIGMSEIAMTMVLNDKQKEIFETINREAHALLGIINSILDFSKIEAGKVEIESIPFDLKLLIGDIGKGIAFLAERKGLSLDIHLSPSVPRYVSGDPGRIRQILMNLSGNALKFTQEGGLTIDCDVVEQEGDLRLVRFSVKDTGIGIEEGHQDKIFESFTQADGSTTRKYGGTGLGISISKQLVELMGGRIGLESQKGKGSTFWFTVALCTHKGNVASLDQAPVDHMTLFVVGGSEDDPLPYHDQLKLLGCHTETVPSGKQALSRLRQSDSASAIHMIIIDCFLSDTDGFTLAEDIKAMEGLNHIPIILTTRTGNIGDGRRCEDIGISGYLNMPVETLTLHRAIQLVMDRSRAGQYSGDMGLVTRHTIAEMYKHVTRILLVEDYPTNRQVALNILRLSGFDVDIAENGKEAVDAFLAETYDVILMDVQMPEMDGYEATRMIRQLELENDKKRTPIIAMTANALTGDREKCLAAGMDDFISKPVSRAAMLSAISSWDSTLSPEKTTSPEMDAVSEKSDSSIDKVPFPLDYERVLEEFMGEKEILMETLEYFLKQGRLQVETLNQALSENMNVMIAEEAHKLKGGASNLTMDILAQAATDLERAGNSGHMDKAGEFIETIVEEFNRLDKVLSDIRQSGEL